jgi:hypothetical protein
MSERARRIRSSLRCVCHVAEPGTLGLANFEASRIQGRLAAAGLQFPPRWQLT